MPSGGFASRHSERRHQLMIGIGQSERLVSNEEELEKHGRVVETVGHASAEEGAFDAQLGVVVEGVEGAVERVQQRIGMAGGGCMSMSMSASCVAAA